ncbi:MAG: hypothetical protein C0490_26090, partial [Marivirga sp.]|nr:hypothetical protein [Marivirga sp.]
MEVRSSLQENENALRNRNLSIVIWGSTGSFHALAPLFQRLTEDLHTAILVVLHLSPNSNVSFLVQHLQQHFVFPYKIASEAEKIIDQIICFSALQAHL